MYELTRAQLAWLKTATQEERHAFLAKGPAEAATMMKRDSGDVSSHDLSNLTYQAAVRGVLIKSEQQQDPNAAIAIAEAERKKFETGAITIDEVALGIDDIGRNLDATLSDAVLVIEAIYVLANLDSESLQENLADLVDELDDETVKEWTWLPSLATSLKECEGYGRYSAREAFCQAIHDDKAYGFLAVARQPIPTWKGDGASFSWGYTTSRMFYGRTADAAIQAAIAWGEVAWNAGKSKPKAA